MLSLESASCVNETGNDSALDWCSYEGLGLVSIAEGETRTKTRNCQQEYCNVLSPHDRSPFATEQSRSLNIVSSHAAILCELCHNHSQGFTLARANLSQ